MRACQLLSAAFWMTMLLAVSALAQETRKWSDVSGRFNVEGTLIRVDGGNVLLKATDGKQLTISLTRLSEADQQYVKDQSENPFTEVAADNPFQQTTLSSGGELPNAVPVKLDSASQMMPKQDIQWDCPPDPCPVEKMAGRPFSFALGNVPFGASKSHSGPFFSRDGKTLALSASAFERTSRVSANVPARVSAMQNRNRDPDFQNFTKIWIGDVTTGKSHVTTLEERLTLMGISPNGKRVALQSGEWAIGSNWGKRQYLSIGEVSESGVAINTVYNPFASVGNPSSMHNLENDIEWAGWVSDSQILVLSARGLLILLDVDDGTPVWQWSLGSGSKVSLSPGGRYAIAVSSGDAFLFQTANGEGIGQLDIPRGTNREFAFSPDGKTIAANAPDGIMLLDATTGQVQEPFYIGENSTGSLGWCDNRYLMAGSRLVDTTTKSVLWNYSHNSANAKASGGNYWYSLSTGSANTIRVVGVALPHGKAIQRADNDTSLFSISPGMNVSLKVEDSVQEGREEIQKSIEKKFADNGWKLANDAPVSVTLKVVTESEETTEYGVSRSPIPIPIPVPRLRMFGEKGVEVKFTPQKYLIEVREGDKLVWTLSHTERPPWRMPLDVVQDKSLQEVVDQAMAKAEYKDWFLKARIPKTIPNPDKTGSSRLTENGVQ